MGIYLWFIIPAVAQQLIFKTYSVEDGLVSNHVQRIYQDKKGFMWIGTIEGLSKYDGHKFINYTTINGLSDNNVNDMYELADGKLYVAENDGTVDILQQDAIVKKAAFRNVVINQFYKSRDNRILAATDTSGIHEIKNGNLVKPRQMFPEATYHSITEFNDSLLIGGSHGFLHILNRELKLFLEIKQVKELVIVKIYKDSKNNVWVCTHKGLKLVSHDKKNNQPLNFTLKAAPFNIPVLRNNLIYDILEDANGNLWIATLYGLVKIDPDGSWQTFTEKNGLPSSNIRCIYQDREKNIWIGTFQGLVKLVTKNDIRTYTTENRLTSNRVRFLRPLANDLFLVGTENGMQLYNSSDGIFSSVSSQQNTIYSGFVENSKPVLFYKFNHRFGKYDLSNRSIVDYILPHPENAQVYCSVVDASGVIFNGTEAGLLISSVKQIIL
ncbi:MAG: two-component regulator propeller domain-containing protein [Chitinophagaceae bacterium]